MADESSPSSHKRASSRKRRVASRLLAGYLVVLVASALTTGWSLAAHRAAARDAEILRAGYVPLVVRIGEALAAQNVLAAQLNHITAAKNPSDVREWIETARRARPLTFSRVRDAAEQGLVGDDPLLSRFREDVVREASSIDKALAAEPERYAALFQALADDDRLAAERKRAEIVKREAEATSKLRDLKTRAEDRMAVLGREARAREERALAFLVGLGALTLAVGALASLYARRVLAPLSAVTERAEAVARGDLSPRGVIASDDEIGELATTFESMVSAIQRARAELVQAERLATIGKMAAHITHEIRNPLSSIGLNLELLEEELAAREGLVEARALVTAIAAEVDRLSRISEQYLSVAKRRAPDLERERIDHLLSGLFAFLEPELRRAGIDAALRCDDDLPEVLIDEGQLRQALVNLVRNAREAMVKDGEIRLEARRAAGGGVELTIDDTGPGIPDELRASIFDPFFTTKARGTGLGLAVTREIIEAHGGTIVCEARRPRGTRFRIHLPEDARQA